MSALPASAAAPRDAAATAGTAHAWPEAPDPRRWVALATVLTALFMALLDVSIVSVAIPAIRTNLAANDADIQFVIAGYGLAYAVTLITGGRLGDIFGRKRLLMLGMGGFVVASALCGLAQSALMLDLSRVLQGAMAALMYPQVLSIVQVTFPPHERARVFGFLGAVIGIATIAGPLVGGLIIRDDLTGGSWRWIFLVNLPIGVAALAAAARVVTESRAPNATRLDLVGAGIATAGLVLLVYPLVEGQVAGWPLWTFICMGVSPFVLLLFVLYERSLPSGAFPLVQLSLFGIPSFRTGLLISLTLLAGIPSFFFTFSLLVQVGLGFSALNAGLTTVPWSLGTACASVMSTRLAPRLGRWTITLGASTMVVGISAIMLTLHAAGTGLIGWDLIPGFLVSGLGMGTVVAPLLNVVLAGVPPRHAGSASGVLTTFQQLGGAIGVAVVGVVFFGLLTGGAAPAASAAAPALRVQLTQAGLSPEAVGGTVATFTRCFEAQASSSNPQQTATGCPSTAGTATSPAASAVSGAASSALARDFVSAMEVLLFFNLGFWALTALLSLALPRARPQAAREGGAATHG